MRIDVKKVMETLAEQARRDHEQPATQTSTSANVIDDIFGKINSAKPIS